MLSKLIQLPNYPAEGSTIVRKRVTLIPAQVLRRDTCKQLKRRYRNIYLPKGPSRGTTFGLESSECGVKIVVPVASDHVKASPRCIRKPTRTPFFDRPLYCLNERSHLIGSQQILDRDTELFCMWRRWGWKDSDLQVPRVPRQGRTLGRNRTSIKVGRLVSTK